MLVENHAGNCGADVAVLNVGHFVGLGMGQCPELPHGFLWQARPKRPTGGESSQ